ncbi:MAG: BON domain-containing protein, partial [Nitrospiraceae bacterium]
TTTAVKSKLVNDKMVNLTRVEVETINGTVHLMGIVENPDQKLRAGRLAAQVEGVRHVDNDLQTQHQ